MMALFTLILKQTILSKKSDIDAKMTLKMELILL